MDPGIERDRRARGRQAGRLGRRPPAARRRVEHDAHRLAARPTRTSAARGGFDAAAARDRRRPVPAGHAGRVRPAALGAKPAPPRAAAARCWSPATRCRSRSTPSSRARLAGATACDVDPRPAPRHRHLEDRPASTGASCRPRRSRKRPARRGRRLHRRQRGLPDAGAGRQRRRVLRRRLGGGVRQPRAPDDEHLPPGRRARASTGSPLPTPRDRDAPADRPRRQRRDRASPPQPYRAQVRVLDMVRDLHARRALPRRDGRRRRARRSSASPTASTSTTRARASRRTRCLRAVDRDFGP